MFCSNCGGEIPENAAFCGHCGAQQSANEQAACNNVDQQPAQSTKKPAKISKKKIAGIVLLGLQAVSLLGVLANGELANLTKYFSNGIYGIFELLGFCLPAIIGAILLIVDKNKAAK